MATVVVDDVAALSAALSAVEVSEPAVVSEAVVVGVAAVGDVVSAAAVGVADVVAGSALVVVGGATVELVDSGAAEGSSDAGSALSPESPQAAASRANAAARLATSAKPERRVRAPVLLRRVRAIELTLAAAGRRVRSGTQPVAAVGVGRGSELEAVSRLSVRQELAAFCTDGVLIAASSVRGCGRGRELAVVGALLGVLGCRLGRWRVAGWGIGSVLHGWRAYCCQFGPRLRARLGTGGRGCPVGSSGLPVRLTAPPSLPVRAGWGIGSVLHGWRAYCCQFGPRLGTGGRGCPVGSSGLPVRLMAPPSLPVRSVAGAGPGIGSVLHGWRAYCCQFGCRLGPGWKLGGRGCRVGSSWMPVQDAAGGWPGIGSVLHGWRTYCCQFDRRLGRDWSWQWWVPCWEFWAAGSGRGCGRGMSRLESGMMAAAA